MRGFLIAVSVAAVLGAWVLLRSDAGTEVPDDPQLTAAQVREEGISNIAEWFAALPRTTASQIAFRCDLGLREARRIKGELRGAFPESAVDALQEECERA
jgi:hypothetical protein